MSAYAVIYGRGEECLWRKGRKIAYAVKYGRVTIVYGVREGRVRTLLNTEG